MSFGMCPLFMLYHLTSIWHSHFSFWVYKLEYFMSCCSSWNQPWLGPLNNFRVALMLISSCSVSFTFGRWLLKPLVFCCIECIFLVWLIIILILPDIIWNTIKLSSPHGLLFYQHSEWTVMLNGSELIILQNGLFTLPTTLATIQQCTL